MVFNKTLRCTLLAITSFFLVSCGGDNEEDSETLRVLAWVGYEEPEIVGPFETEFGVEVLTETFTGADKMFAKLSQAPDAYDVVVIDPEYIEKLNNAGFLSSLDEADFEFSGYIDSLKRFPLSWIDGELKAVLIRFGINSLVYNSEKITDKEAQSYQILFADKVTGKVGIWDWYLPNMGIFSLINGNMPPYQLDREGLEQVRETMARLSPQVSAFLGSFSDVNAALARGDIWLVPAHGEHTAAILADEGLPIKWTVPDEGGIMWVETLGIPREAGNRELAIKYIQYIQRPEVLAKLTWRRAYRSNTPSVEAINLLSPAQQDLLHVHNGEEAEALVNSVQVRRLPTYTDGATAENDWQAAWQAFKAGNL